MGERTPKLNLYKPTPGETGWGSLINENFDKIDDITPAKIGAEPAFTKNTAFNKNFGNTEGTVCQGNDPRLSEAGVLKPHADTTTKYGGSTDTLYGHAKASSTVPKQAGTANVGAEVNEFARGDHIHPAQTNVTGNAGTATKLKTARNISLSGNIKGTATAFDGSADIAIPVTDVEATKLKTARKIELKGPVTGNATFDGTTDIALTTSISSTELPKASKTEYGAVKIGDGIKVDNGIISCVHSFPMYAKMTLTDKGFGMLIESNTYLSNLGHDPIGVMITNKGSGTKNITYHVVFESSAQQGNITLHYKAKNIFSPSTIKELNAETKHVADHAQVGFDYTTTIQTDEIGFITFDWEHAGFYPPSVIVETYVEDNVYLEPA